MTRTTSVAMTAEIERTLHRHLLRKDEQEDLCLALYRPSTGRARTTALIREVVSPEQGDREVHGNVTVNAQYVLRAVERAQKQGCGVAILHSHPRGRGWQGLSGPDHDAESSYANLVRESSGLPLVGLTLAGRDHSWSARHWDHGHGRSIARTDCTNVRVVGDRLTVSWNDRLVPPPPEAESQTRTLQCWGAEVQQNLARRNVLIVGGGSVGLDVAVRLAASGLVRVTVMDFDIVELHNLDRLIGAELVDVLLRHSKVDVALREMRRNATAASPAFRGADLSICAPDGFSEALDYDLVFSCVDRPWARAVLNGMAYSDLIPVIDGGIAIDTFQDGTMRNATWRSHVLRPGRPCMVCTRQLDMGAVAPDIEGLLDDPSYISNRPASATGSGQNVAVLSTSVSASLLAQYVSFSAGPAGMGDPGPLRYSLSTHTLEHISSSPRPDCPFEAEALGDGRQALTGEHKHAERVRRRVSQVGPAVRLGRAVDSGCRRMATALAHFVR